MSDEQPKKPYDLNFESSEKEVKASMKDDTANAIMNANTRAAFQQQYLRNILDYKLQKKLISKQNKLVIATWFLVIVTAILAYITAGSPGWPF